MTDKYEEVVEEIDKIKEILKGNYFTLKTHDDFFDQSAKQIVALFPGVDEEGLIKINDLKRLIPKGFHFLLEYEEELKYILEAQLLACKIQSQKERAEIWAIIENHIAFTQLEHTPPQVHITFNEAELEALKKKVTGVRDQSN